MSVAVLHDRIYAIGGEGYNWGVPFVREFDPLNGSWALRDPMPTPRDEAAIVAVGDSLHVIGGSQDYGGSPWDWPYWQLDTHEVYTVRLDYAWDFGDGSTAAGKTATHAYSAPGVYTVTLTVTDLKGGVGTDTLTVTILGNAPPVPDAGGPYVGVEASPLTLSAAASSDPDGDPLTYRWDLDADGAWDTVATPDPTLTYVWGDDFAGTVAVEVSDGANAATATAAVTILNADPTLDDVQVYAAADLTLRVAGEKWHDVCLDVVDSGSVNANACVTRYPGSPDDQSATITGTHLNLLGDTSLAVYYTPDNDPVNGQRNGDNPAWVILTFADGSETRLKHNFNVQHPDTWTWTIDDLRPLLVGKPLAFTATASDVGSDDLTFALDFGDGGTHTATVYNDGVGPDPYPSPAVNPITATASTTHAYAAAGTYTLTITVRDDDGATVGATIPIAVG